MHVAQRLVVLDRCDRRALWLEEGPADVEEASVRVPAGSRQGFATYLNAFPAAYWVRWTGARTARLEIVAEGGGTVRVVRSDARGQASVVETAVLPGDRTRAVLDVDVTSMGDGGWLWFEVEAIASDVLVVDARWLVDVAPRRTGTVCLSITTMDKPELCVATLRRIADAAELRDTVDTVFVVDQGTRRLVDHPELAGVAARLGTRLTVIEQRNLGGSGGFSRGMLETLDRPGADAVLILDDDVEVLPESLLRAVRFHRAAREPVVIGGQMLDLSRPTVLNSFSEVIHPRTFRWGPPRFERQWHDLAQGTLRDTPWLHERSDSDFNGWWMCLLPTDVLRRVGLSMPLFLKWDDAEFGLRAAEHGTATVSLPGAALWHVAWTDKDDTVGWQAYLHTRNRVVTALLHARRPLGGLLLLELLATDLKLLLSMRYYAVDLHVRALRDVRRGPGALHVGLDRVVATASAVAPVYRETVRHAPGDPVFDAVAPSADDRHGGGVPPVTPRPSGAAALVGFALRGLVRTACPVRGRGRTTPNAALRREQATWWTLPKHDSVLVLAADGSSGTWLRRDARVFWRLALATTAAHVGCALRWRRAARAWRAAAPALTAPSTWRATFGAAA